MRAYQFLKETKTTLSAFNDEQPVAEGSLEEIDRRGFLKGMGAAAVAGATGSAMAQSQPVDASRAFANMRKDDPLVQHNKDIDEMARAIYDQIITQRGQPMDRKQQQMWMTIAREKASEKLAKYAPGRPATQPQSSGFPSQGSERRVSRNIDNFESVEQGVAEDNASPTKISFKVKKGRGRFATEMIVNGQQAGVYQYDANTGRSIAEVFPEFRSQGLGKILVLHAIYTAAKLGLDFQEDESRTAAYDNVLDSLSSNGYIVDDDGYWYVTGEGEQYLQQSLKNKAPPVAENFADGKGPGRPGDSVRHGIPKNATMAELEKASHSAGRKGQLARWQLNMRRGKAELSEIKQRLDAKCWPGTRKEGTKIKGGIRVNNCVPVSETGIKKPQLKTYAARVKLKQSGYTNIVDATVMARNPEMARRLLHQLYGGNSSVVGQPREIK